MKKVVTLFAVLAALFAYVPQSVEARSSTSRISVSTYVSGYSSCGCPIYTKRVLSHYNRYGRPVYNYYHQAVNHRCKNHRVNGVRYFSKSNAARYSGNSGYRKRGSSRGSSYSRRGSYRY